MTLTNAERIAQLVSATRMLLSELTWCGGSKDFAPGGVAREGWMRGPVPAMIQAEAMLEEVTRGVVPHRPAQPAASLELEADVPAYAAAHTHPALPEPGAFDARALPVAFVQVSAVPWTGGTCELWGLDQRGRMWHCWRDDDAAMEYPQWSEWVLFPMPADDQA